MKTLPLLAGLAFAILVTGAQAADYTAELDWAGRVVLAMPVAGVLESVPAHAGQRLKQGELLAALNAVQFQTGVLEAKAELERAGLEAMDAQRDLARVKELYARTVSATTELDAAQLRQSRAAAALAIAQARLDRARRQLAESELRAPFDAIVLSRSAEPGQATANACAPTPLFTVARADGLLAVAMLGAEHAARLRPGQKAEVVLGSETVPGEIQGISPQAKGAWRIEVAIPFRSGLVPGRGVSLRLP